MGKAIRMGRCASFSETIKGSLSVTFPKSLTIADWKLGAVHKSLQICVLAAIIYKMYNEGLYLKTIVPSACLAICVLSSCPM